MSKPREYWREEAMMFSDKREPYFSQWVKATPAALAAEDMLEALRTIHVFYSDFAKHVQVPVSELRALLEKTIAKAEGRAHGEGEGRE